MHLKRIRWPGILLGASAIAAVTTVWAQTGGGYDASFTTTSSGGQTMSNGSYVLQTGVGQSVAGTTGGGTYSLDIGVLAGGTGAASAGSPTASPSPSPTVAPGSQKRVIPSLAKDGLY